MSTLHSVPQIISSLKITKSERHMDLLIKTTNTQTNPQMSFPSQQDLSANYYRAEGPTSPEPGIPREEGRVLHPKRDSLGRLNSFISGGGGNTGDGDLAPQISTATETWKASRGLVVSRESCFYPYLPASAPQR